MLGAMRSPKRYARGFTLVEMLGVLFIIATLMGILLPVIAKVRTKAKIAKAQSEIESLSIALRMYESDLGKFPPNTNTSADALYVYLGTPRISSALNITVGPYMEFKSSELGTGNVYVDPWKRSYVYVSRDGSPAASHNAYSFDLHSVGPDGVSGNADDVQNW